MCGISGVIAGPNQAARYPLSILSMGEALEHRGPNFVGHYISPIGNVLFNHRRLSLVGLDGRSTVITIPKKGNPKHAVALVFNGEIYNFRELKQEFVAKGYTSVSPSDFEVIIFAYQEWGEDCVDHLIGEFAFVLYDEETGKTFMARDRTGVRPLFYAFHNDEFLFASEPKAILEYPGVSREIDRTAVAEYLLMSHAFAAGNQNERSSFYQAIKQFPPAHRAVLGGTELQFTRYWDLPMDTPKEPDQPERGIREALSRSVAARVPDELPVAIALSGGLDSSVIAALAVQSKNPEDVTAFSVRYTGDANDDYRHAEIMARHCGIKLVDATVTPEMMTEYIDRCIEANDGPVDSIRRVGMYANYETMRKHGFKVALIGEGSDEFNLGYYHKFPGLKLDLEICASADNLKNAFLRRADYVREFFTDAFLAQISFDEIIDDIVAHNYTAAPSDDPMDRMQYFYARRFLQYLEDGNDRAAMASSVEARVPFVDPEVITASLAVPREQNIADDNEKMALRKAFADLLPPEIANRQKAPFPANEDLASHSLIAAEFRAAIAAASGGVWQLFNRARFERLADDYEQLIAELREQGGGKQLVSWLSLGENVSLRTNQIFSFLTLLRWITNNQLV